MFCGAIFIIIGTCIQAPSATMAQFKGGRFVLGVGVALSASMLPIPMLMAGLIFHCFPAAGPSYVAEIAHPVYRGILTGIYNSFWFIGCQLFPLPVCALTG
jgi:MFS family permease